MTKFALIDGMYVNPDLVAFVRPVIRDNKPVDDRCWIQFSGVDTEWYVPLSKETVVKLLSFAPPTSLPRPDPTKEY